MKIISRILSILLFVVFFGFALQNKDSVNLQFFPGTTMQGPLVLFLLGFFVFGAILGVLAMAPAVFRHRRNATKTKKALTSMQKEQEAQRLAESQAPQPDSIKNI
ncbi:putative integral membrane protein [Collimonas sp. PA-H2]|uniref:LapA family protein n=1 Tax=Collimonas sp. PA-H2 TaxID=1881062 RepID=UPI000BF68A73|nr:lipopolysaccharide assembly protein LapA domain-containing protein [Collimonas sp. PA-H2]PFH08961.1 putative integral membrane protein [Collimonas sp. PA-H2]